MKYSGSEWIGAIAGLRERPQYFFEVIPTNSASHCLIGGGVSNDLSKQLVSGALVQRDRCRLELRCAQLDPVCPQASTFIFRKSQHRRRDSAPSRGRVHIHASELEG